MQGEQKQNTTAAPSVTGNLVETVAHQSTIVAEHLEKPATQPVKLPAFFDKYPDIKARLVNYLKDIPREEKKKSLEEFYKFINGDLTWAEIRKISKRMQKELARVAYLNFKLQNFAKAETLFKGLSVIDHTNWYYRSALGAVYQKQRKFERAVEEYSKALSLRNDEITSLVNRGECYLMLRDFDLATHDFDHVCKLNLPQNNPWLMRARILIKRVHMAQAGNGK